MCEKSKRGRGGHLYGAAPANQWRCPQAARGVEWNFDRHPTLTVASHASTRRANRDAGPVKNRDLLAAFIRTSLVCGGKAKADDGEYQAGHESLPHGIRSFVEGLNECVTD